MKKKKIFIKENNKAIRINKEIYELIKRKEKEKVCIKK